MNIWLRIIFYSYSGTATPELPSVGSIPPPPFFCGLFYYLCGMETKDEEKKLIYNLESMYGLYGKEYRHFLNKLRATVLRIEMGGNEGIHSSPSK